MQAIKFHKHYVTNGTTKARVHYSAFRMVTTGQDCVTLYAKSYDDSRKLGAILADGYENNTDTQTDYFEKGRARILAGQPLYAAALARATLAA
jgi:phenylacetate-coenzyme A ligase PaaK-like adenylate-forming protein